MIVSRDDAFGFLSRLATSSSKLVAVLAARFGEFSFECCTVELSPDILTLEAQPRGTGPEDAPVQSWMISMSAVVEFGYGDVREAKPRDRDDLEGPFGPLLGALTLYFSETDALVIAEHEEFGEQEEP
jgi:hypothetical protein